MQPNNDIKPGNVFIRCSNCAAFLHSSVRQIERLPAQHYVYYTGEIIHIKPRYIITFLKWIRKNSSDVQFALCLYDNTLIELADIYINPGAHVLKVNL